VSEELISSTLSLKPGRLGSIAVYLAFAAVVVRTVGLEANRPYLTLYLGLELVYILLFTLVLWKYRLPGWLMHLYLGLQSALVLWVLSIRPQFDFVVLLFALLTYPVSLAFVGHVRWFWIGILILLTGGSLMGYLGVLRGLALSLTTIAAEIVLPAYISVNHETEMSRARSQALLDQLKHAHQQLQTYAVQVEELSAVQERNRLARELHDTISQQIFSISLTIRSAQLLLKNNPQRAVEQLQYLQSIAADALSQLRALITQLRPPQQS